MEIYIEYAFLENFLFDSALLYLALKGARIPISKAKLCLSAAIGSVFAVVFPLLNLNAATSLTLKILVGLLLCMLVCNRVNTKIDWGRYALTAFFFFAFTFGLGGALHTAIYGFFEEKAPFLALAGIFLVLAVVLLFGIKKLYQRRKIERLILDCKILVGGKTAVLQGFVDSGNRVMKNGLPVCFLSAEIYYDLFLSGDLAMDFTFEYVEIHTLSGEKRLPIKRGAIEIENGKERRKSEVYFASSTNMLSRGYKMIIGVAVLGDEEGVL